MVKSKFSTICVNDSVPNLRNQDRIIQNKELLFGSSPDWEVFAPIHYFRGDPQKYLSICHRYTKQCGRGEKGSNH